MNFDDDEHRVKRILDDESHNTANDATKKDAEQKKNIEENSSNKQGNSISTPADNINSSKESRDIPLYDGDISESNTATSASSNANTDTSANTDTESDISSNELENNKDNKNSHNKSSDTSRDKTSNDKASNDKATKSEGLNNNNNNNDTNDTGEIFIPPSQKVKKEIVEEPMGLLDHLGELRRRLTRIVIIILLGFIGFYGVSEVAYFYLAQPLIVQLPEGSTLIYTSPQGAFFTYLKVALMLSIVGTSPFTFYQIWAFIAPGLYKEEQSAVAPLALFSAFFFISGAAFCYFMVFPIAFQFFLGFTSDVVRPMISVEEYLSFVLKLIVAFGLVFEMPLFSYFLAKLRIITPEGMRKHRKYAVLAIFVIAAILTPPDVFSQMLMAVPMLILYEVSIYVAKAARGKSQKDDEKNKKNDTQEDINDRINNFK